MVARGRDKSSKAFGFFVSLCALVTEHGSRARVYHHQFTIAVNVYQRGNFMIRAVTLYA